LHLEKLALFVTWARQITELRLKDQAFFGIKPQHMSLSNWLKAKHELSFVERRILPYQKLEALLLTARAIYDEVFFFFFLFCLFVLCDC